MTIWHGIAGVLAVVAGISAFAAWRLYAEALAARRDKYIRSYVFSGSLFDKLRFKHRHLDLKDCQLVARALREFFLAHLKRPHHFVGMPSRVVDDLWHEFILDTREYDKFCRAAFGRYFHHTPAASAGTTPTEDIGLRLTWRHACAEENINLRYTLPDHSKKVQTASAGACSGTSSSGHDTYPAGLGSEAGYSGSDAGNCSGGSSGGGGGGCGGGCGGS